MISRDDFNQAMMLQLMRLSDIYFLKITLLYLFLASGQIFMEIWIRIKRNFFFQWQICVFDWNPYPNPTEIIRSPVPNSSLILKERRFWTYYDKDTAMKPGTNHKRGPDPQHCLSTIFAPTCNDAQLSSEEGGWEASYCSHSNMLFSH